MLRPVYVFLSLSMVSFATGRAQMAGMKEHDPDKKVAGGGLPAGWNSRTDRANAKIEDVKFVPGADGYHVTSGPAAIYWKSADKTTVPFTASATFMQLKAPTHPEAYGIFYMGSKLDAPEQNYAYLLVRGDGKVMVKHRAGAEVHTIMDWTDNAAVHKADASGKASNTLSVEAKADSTRLFVNGAQITAIGGAYAKADGYVGLRVNHNLDVEVKSFSVKSGGTTVGDASSHTKGRKGKKVARKTD